MSNWKDKTDFEINKAVAMQFGTVDVRQLKDISNYIYCEIAGVRSFRNFCISPSDAWPIIVENKISIINYDDEWEASIDFEQDTGKFGTSETWTKSISDKNALRAAMIVYLEMNGVKP